MKYKINDQIPESEVFQLVLNTEQTFSRILGLVKQIKNKNEIIQNLYIMKGA